MGDAQEKVSNGVIRLGKNECTAAVSGLLKITPPNGLCYQPYAFGSDGQRTCRRQLRQKCQGQKREYQESRAWVDLRPAIGGIDHMACTTEGSLEPTILEVEILECEPVLKDPRAISEPLLKQFVHKVSRQGNSRMRAESFGLWQIAAGRHSARKGNAVPQQDR